MSMLQVTPKTRFTASARARSAASATRKSCPLFQLQTNSEPVQAGITSLVYTSGPVMPTVCDHTHNGASVPAAPAGRRQS